MEPRLPLELASLLLFMKTKRSQSYQPVGSNGPTDSQLGSTSNINKVQLPEKSNISKRCLETKDEPKTEFNALGRSTPFGGIQFWLMLYSIKCYIEKQQKEICRTPLMRNASAHTPEARVGQISLKVLKQTF